jgi:hypothetical protein
MLDDTTPAARAWFQELLQRHSPDTVLVHYVWYAPLLFGPRAAPRSFRTVLESQDLVTVNKAMVSKIDPLLRHGPVFKADLVPEEALSPDFYDGISAEALEFETIDHFDVTLAISQGEAEAMRTHTQHTHVHMTTTPVSAELPRDSDGQFALFPMGPHPFNLQAYAWFLRKVLPRVVAECPDFELAVSGITYQRLTLEFHPRVRNLGFVADVAQLWALGRMVINPVFGGTGQPIKTIEAMAAGLPVIIHERFAKAAPVEHMRNGFVARDAEEFAQHCITLWKDRDLAWRMGVEGRLAVQERCSRANFARQLEAVLM